MDQEEQTAQKMPDDVANMKTIYGYGSFKKLLMASECFEIFDGPLLNGGFRTFYRFRDATANPVTNESIASK